MAIGVMLTSGFLGFIVSIVCGLLLGLGFMSCLAVYSGVGVSAALSMFTVRGIWCFACRQFS